MSDLSYEEIERLAIERAGYNPVKMWVDLAADVLDADPQMVRQLQTAVDNLADVLNDNWPLTPDDPVCYGISDMHGALGDLTKEVQMTFMVLTCDILTTSVDGPHTTAVTLRRTLETIKERSQ